VIPLLAALALVLFGGAKILELGRSPGQAIREFERGVETPDAAPEPKPGSGPGPDGPKSA
jgi:Sec-independent protein translocase protein TatA